MNNRVCSALSKSNKAYAHLHTDSSFSDASQTRNDVIEFNEGKIVKVNGSGAKLGLPVCSGIDYAALSDCGYKTIKIADNNKGVGSDWFANAVVSESVQHISVSLKFLLGCCCSSFSDSIRDKISLTGSVNKSQTIDAIELLVLGLNHSASEVALKYIYDLNQTEFFEAFSKYLPELHKDIPNTVEGLKSIELDSESRELLKVFKTKIFDSKKIPVIAGSKEVVDIETLIYLMIKMPTHSVNSKEKRLLKLVDRESLSAYIMSGYDADSHSPNTPDVGFVISSITHLGTAKDVSKVLSDIKEMERRGNRYGTTTRDKMVNTFYDSYGYCDYNDTLLMFDKRGMLQEIAKARKCSVESLREKLLSATDNVLDENGQITFNYGSRTITATLRPDMTFAFLDNSTNKISKTLPKAKTGDDETLVNAATAEFKELKENLKNISYKRIQMINSMLYSGDSLKVSDWEKQYLSSTIVKTLSKGILWGVYLQGDELINTFRLDGNCKPVNIDGDKVVLFPYDLISVVDAAQLSADELEKWRNIFWGEGIKAIVNQFEAPARYVPWEYVESRYKKCSVSVGYAKAALGYNPWDEYMGTVISETYISIDISSSRHQSEGEMPVEKVEIRLKKPFDKMTSKQKRLWNRGIIHLDTVLHPEKQIVEIVASGDVENVKSLVDTKLITTDNITNMVGISIKAKNQNVTAYLLELKKDWLGDLQDPFSDFVL